jgi:hypothetical protein
MENSINTLVSSVFGFIVVFGISFLFSYPVYFLWNNSLVGAVNGVNEVTWIQAWGISFLCSLLFKPSTKDTK